jgi:hypothetical protein
VPEQDKRSDAGAAWPELPYAAWTDTLATLHRWSQIVGKTRLASSPWMNHQWHVTLYVSARGLTTSLIPHGRSAFQIDMDFVDHRVIVAKESGAVRIVGMYPRSVADFYAELTARMREIELHVPIHSIPNEIEGAIPFAEDHVHASYDPEYATRCWRILLACHRVFTEFRAGYRGKCSPVHLFWGSFDLAVTRFNGRRAPPHPGGIVGLPDWVSREAYSHEVSSAGFWPGGETHPHPIFYSYAYPSPPGFGDRKVQPVEAGWNPDFGEFVLPYEAVRQSERPERVLMAFLTSTYEAAAELGGWDRSELEWGAGERPRRGSIFDGDGAPR